MATMKITKLKASAVVPEYQTEHASGMDLCACLDEPRILKPMERAMIPTGLAVELLPGYEAQIRARSGLSIKYGLTMVNGIGTIDADYRGEIGILVINLGQDEFVIEPGMRIAQLIIAKYEKVDWQEADSLNETARGDGGFGSTGVKN
ncbi:MAG: dUTP diphosphatase [Candidatus Saccharimonadales bacterium]